MTRRASDFLAPHREVALRARHRPADLDERVLAIENRQAVTDVLTAYLTFYDAQDLDALMGLYAPDPELRLSYISDPLHGEAAIRSYFKRILAAQEKVFHHLTNTAVALDGHSRATATSYVFSVTQLVNGQAYLTSGSYCDSLELHGDRWLIRSHAVTADLSYSAPPLPADFDRFAGN